MILAIEEVEEGGCKHVTRPDNQCIDADLGLVHLFTRYHREEHLPCRFGQRIPKHLKNICTLKDSLLTSQNSAHSCSKFDPVPLKLTDKSEDHCRKVKISGQGLSMMNLGNLWCMSVMIMNFACQDIRNLCWS